jgi:hypothetical protein
VVAAGERPGLSKHNPHDFRESSRLPLGAQHAKASGSLTGNCARTFLGAFRDDLPVLKSA